MDEVLLVTGGSRGIGAATAVLAARKGCKVAVNYTRNEEAAEEVVRAIRAAGGTAVAIHGDVADEQQVLALFAQVDARLGRLTALVNNASQNGPVWGKILALVDPVAEMGGRMGPMGMMGGGGPSPEFIKLLKAWGVDFDASKAVGDIATARRVQFGGGARPTVTEYVAWLGLDRRSIDEKDVLSGGIERLNLATSGFLAKAEGATTQVTPILVTSPQAMQIAAEKFSGAPDPVALLRAYKPEGKPLMLAARIAGTANSAYPDGVPKPVKVDGDDKAKPDGAKSEGDKPAQSKAEAPKPDATKDAKEQSDKPDDEFGFYVVHKLTPLFSVWLVCEQQ